MRNPPSFSPPPWSKLFLLASLSVTLTACPAGSDLDNSDAFRASGPGCDPTPIFESKCSTSICHEGPDPLGSVDLVNGDIAQNVLGVQAAYAGVTDPENCPATPELIVDPNNVEESLLLKKLLGTYSCGSAMPVGLPLEADQIECIREWALTISQGAEAGTGGAATGGTGGAADATGGTGGADAATGGTGGAAAATGGTGSQGAL